MPKYQCHYRISFILDIDQIDMDRVASYADDMLWDKVDACDFTRVIHSISGPELIIRKFNAILKSPGLWDVDPPQKIHLLNSINHTSYCGHFDNNDIRQFSHLELLEMQNDICKFCFQRWQRDRSVTE